MKEHPIIFSTEMVKAILDGKKVQTRRIIKPQPPEGCGIGNLTEGGQIVEWVFCDEDGDILDMRFPHCLYGQVGDKLWVKETWRIESFMEGEPILFGFKDGKTKEDSSCDEVNYEDWYERVCMESTDEARKAFGKGLVRKDEGDIYLWDIGKSPCRWRPSIFMPHWASRITLEIIGIKIERLQDISTEDIITEGCSIKGNHDRRFRTPYLNFANLWDSINGKKYPWESNPWIWCISFKRIKPA